MSVSYEPEEQLPSSDSLPAPPKSSYARRHFSRRLLPPPTLAVVHPRTSRAPPACALHPGRFPIPARSALSGRIHFSTLSPHTRISLARVFVPGALSPAGTWPSP